MEDKDDDKGKDKALWADRWKTVKGEVDKDLKLRKASWDVPGLGEPTVWPNITAMFGNLADPNAELVLKEYGRQVQEWGRRVRRDILVLENWLEILYPNIKFFGDPGDPPPPPE
jgi:hypothetical protein